ncbi:hypothetical protein Tco_1243522 [Tanacetum coccineum]
MNGNNTSNNRRYLPDVRSLQAGGFLKNFRKFSQLVLGWIIFKLPLQRRVTKENRTAGVLDNFVEGERYAEHAVRKFVRNKSPEIMPSINSFFADPK